MSEKHLETGATLPPLAKDTLRTYNMRYCPFGQRTRLVLAHKQIPFETVYVNLKKKPDWFYDKNPLGTVPTLEFNNEIVYESAICNEYLDEKYPDIKMLPADPYQKARIKLLMDGFSKVISVFYSMMRTPEDDSLKIVFLELMSKYETALNGKFFGGDSPNMLDAHIWPWFERLPAVKEVIGYDVLNAGNFPKLKQWFEDMVATRMVKGSYMSAEKHAHYIRQFLSGEIPDYDVE